MSEKTIFEKIVERTIPASIVYEDDTHIAILDINPFEKGHTLVIPKEPYETIMDMPEASYLSLQRLVHRLAKRMHEELGGGINIHINNYPEAHQEVPHVHVHIIPRHEDKAMYHPENHTGSYESDEEKQAFVEKLSVM